MIHELRALASDLVARAGLASKAGITFGGKRDVYEALGYKKTLLPVDYRERYKRGGISNRIVKAFPKATWHGGPDIIEDENPNNQTEFEKQWDELVERVHVWSVFQRADVLAGLGRYAVVLIGAMGKLEEELPDMKTPEDVFYLASFSEEDVKIKSWVENTEDSRFGMPDVYEFRRTRTEKGRFSQTRLIHHSRIIHIADGILDEQGLGEPRLEAPWNLLDDLEKMTGGGSEAFWLRANQGYQFDIDKDTVLDPQEKEELETQADEFAHNLRRYLRTRNMKINVLGSDVANFDRNVDAVLSQVAGTTGIPKRILLGSEMGELASSQDRTNWHERVEDRRLEYAEPVIVRPFVDRLIGHGALKEAEYTVRWPGIAKMDEEQRANIADRLAGVNAKAQETIITGAEIRDRILELPPIEEVKDEDDLIPEDVEAAARTLKKSFHM